MPNDDYTQDLSYTTPAAAISLNINLTELPICPKCKEGVLVPIQSETYSSKSVLIKGWVCMNCYHNIISSKGDLIVQQVQQGEAEL